MSTVINKDEKKQEKSVENKLDIQVIDEDINLNDLINKKSNITRYEEGSMVQGTILDISKNRILVDLGNSVYGLILGKETKDIDNDVELKIGNKIDAIVIKSENNDGYVILSIRKVASLKAWDYLKSIEGTNTIIKVKITDVNRGGLLFDYKGIKGFIPVSQLMPEHYPRVSEKDYTKIVSKLNKLKGQYISTSVLAVDKSQEKLILSEKKAYETEIEKLKSELEIGRTYEGKVTGFSDFGIFVTFNGVEGLVHLSEISWGKVNNPRDYVKEGDIIPVMLIGFNAGKLSLSMKRLQADPWLEMARSFKLGQKVSGPVVRIEKYGYFIRLENGLEGLVHLSQISWDKVDDIHKFVKIGEIKTAEIIVLDFENHQIGLSEKKLIERKDKDKEEDKSKKESKKNKEENSELKKNDEIKEKNEKKKKKDDEKKLNKEDKKNLDKTSKKEK